MAANSHEQATAAVTNTSYNYPLLSDLNKDSTAELIEEEDYDDQLQPPSRGYKS